MHFELSELINREKCHLALFTTKVCFQSSSEVHDDSVHVHLCCFIPEGGRTS